MAKKTKLGLLCVAVLGSAVLAQSRVDTFNAVTTTRATLWPLPDGGCVAQWCGSTTTADGGVTDARCTDDVELRAATNRTRCNGLLQAGEGRIARELRFDVDAGAP